MSEEECKHEGAKAWHWGNDKEQRHIAMGWNWCEECGALVQVEMVNEAKIRQVLLPKRAIAKAKGTPVEAQS